MRHQLLLRGFERATDGLIRGGDHLTYAGSQFPDPLEVMGNAQSQAASGAAME